MRQSFSRGIVKCVVKVKPSFDSSELEQGVSDDHPDKREFNDTSTWAQIIRVLEETSAEQ
jgi:hypothetical protein